MDLGVPLIGTNEGKVVRLAVDHLLERGFRRFAFCGFVGTNYSDRRSELFNQMIQSVGYPRDIFSTGEVGHNENTYRLEQRGLERKEELSRWLEGLPKPFGLMACNDIRGLQALSACRGLGIRMPYEVAVNGVDNDEVFCFLADPPLSSVVPNAERIGYEAASMLSKLISSGGADRVQTVYVDPVGVERRVSTDVLSIEDRKVAGGT